MRRATLQNIHIYTNWSVLRDLTFWLWRAVLGYIKIVFITIFGLFVKQSVNNGYNNCLVVISYRHTVIPPAVTDRTVSVQTCGDCVFCWSRSWNVYSILLLMEEDFFPLKRIYLLYTGLNRIPSTVIFYSNILV